MWPRKSACLLGWLSSEANWIEIRFSMPYAATVRILAIASRATEVALE